MKTNTKVAHEWRIDWTAFGQDNTYKILCGSDPMPLVVAERTTKGKSPGTLRAFNQIVKEHNSHAALVAACEAALADESTCSTVCDQCRAALHLAKGEAL